MPGQRRPASGGAPPKGRSRKKVICRHYLSLDGCAAGTSCRYLHVTLEELPSGARVRTGGCQRGLRCPFRHIGGERHADAPGNKLCRFFGSGTGERTASARSDETRPAETAAATADAPMACMSGVGDVVRLLQGAGLIPAQPVRFEVK